MFQQRRERKEQEEQDQIPLRGKKVTFGYMRATDMLCNKFVNLPAPETEREEILIGSERTMLKDTWDLFKKKHTAQKGNIKRINNLTRA